MIAKRFTKNKLVKAIFGCLFGIMGMLAGVNSIMATEPVYAEPVDSIVTEDENNEGEKTEAENDGADLEEIGGESCDDSFGKIGWIICPGTGVASKAVDFLYDKIETVLVINPVEMKDGEPIYEIWKYAKGITNIVFIIFLMVVVYSQLTGLGITNYGIKKALPKLIVAAVMVNLSFVICSLAVDVSNVIGNGLRGIFTSIEQSTVALINVDEGIATSDLYSVLAGGSMLAIFLGIAAFERGTMWMLLLTVLTALAAVVIGLVTIAMRQAVVMLLVMVSPLAVVAYMLPNTEQWFKKWRQLLVKMLVFYPIFSVLFGASSLAGWAIIASAISSKDGFMTLIGVGVRIFPLFFSWKLMQMSGTVLGTINSKLTSLASRPLAKGRSWAESRRDATRAKNLASGRVYTPSLALMQYMNNRKIARDEETSEHLATVKNRGLAYAAMRNYKKNGTPSREGLRAYEEQARNMRYVATVERHKSNMNGGYGRLDAVKQIAEKENPTARERALLGKLEVLDWENINAADDLKFELSRGAQIEYENAQGFQQRVTDAMNAHADTEANGDKRYQKHKGVLDGENGLRNLARYNSMSKIMDGNEIGVYFAAADAAHSFNAQSQVVRGKFKDFFNNTVPTQDVENRLRDLTTTNKKTTNAYIDPIISGLQILNMRGDTDILRRQMNNVFADRKIDLGTYASQALASFMMFDVKDNDPFLRRFGKYINIETAQMFNENDPEKRRTRRDVSLYEYVNGEYVDCDEDGNVKKDENGKPKMRKSKMDMGVLLQGTPFKGIERTAIKDMIEGVRENSVDIDEDGNKTDKFNYDKFKKNEKKLWDSIMPNIISDQFTFLSGGEPIKALSKGVTGIDAKKHSFDWNGIFGKDVAKQLTPEQKKDYIDFVHERTKDFLGGHVPSQIARTKTDMLNSIKNQYTLVDAAKNPELWDKIQKEDYEMDKKSYDRLEDEHIDEVRKEFVGSFKEDAVKIFLKQLKRGYQGEAKDGLIKLFNPDLSDDDGRKRSVEDDEEGALISSDVDNNVVTAEPLYNDARNEIEAIFNSYRGSMANDVAGFWGQIRDAVESESVKRGKSTIASDFDAALSQYTSVSALYADIMNRLFGGF